MKILFIMVLVSLDGRESKWIHVWGANGIPEKNVRLIMQHLAEKINSVEIFKKFIFNGDLYYDIDFYNYNSTFIRFVSRANTENYPNTYPSDPYPSNHCEAIIMFSESGKNILTFSGVSLDRGVLVEVMLTQYKDKIDFGDGKNLELKL